MRTIIISLLAVFIALPAFSGTRVKETWQADRSGGSCKLTMNYTMEKLSGQVSTAAGCNAPLRKAKSFAYTDGSRTHMVLFARKNLKGKTLATFSGSGNNMQGNASTGDAVRMFKSSSSSTSTSASVNINITTNSGNGGGTGGVKVAKAGCITYANRKKTCASAADVQNPKIPVFQTIRMKVLANQKMYPFSGGKGIARDESVKKGSCRKVRKCEQAFNSNEMWCEIAYPDSLMTGWVKRMDDKYVYLRKGC